LRARNFRRKSLHFQAVGLRIGGLFFLSCARPAVACIGAQVAPSGAEMLFLSRPNPIIQINLENASKR
jgi:hypothetical protein